ncbi:hypothetical protein O6R05_02470 [Peptoniphilus equinus]|uniref:Uncharacterized protein n=1 Tax=Peptoniphilus equinus TaxID=3016343 RepID=A0ABY7QVJ0_9FIRM|nr:hypothetical protein [Peptoniphilus equinus]WBW50426.1 hypothetical protein O6R05_02470 [Peptoniphilus equinus]
MNRQRMIEKINTALDSVEEARGAFKSARRWGIYDTVFGGAISSFIKRSRSRKGERFMTDLQYKLRAVADELEGVDLEGLNIKGGSFLGGIVDIFYDNALVDLFVLGNTQSNLKQLDRIEKALLDLKHRI